jgi:photosystem II stability/assembly factor-like uncharacterized protein
MSSRFPLAAILGLRLFLFAVGAAAQSPVWTQLASSPTGTAPRNDDIHFVDPLNGWAARATDGVYRTTNGGLSFHKVLPALNAYSGTNLLAHFRSINFASPTRGWAGNLGPGSYDASVTDTNLLFETFDGGVTWIPVAAINQSDMKGFCSIQVLDAQHIYGGGRVRGPAHFAWSTDGGTNWSVTNLTAAGIMGGIMDVYFKDPLNGFLVGMDTNLNAGNCSSPYRGTMARTTDGGLTWSNVVTTPITCSYFWKMSWPSPNVGYVTLQQNGAHDTVVFYKTTDGGATWVSNGIPIVDIGGPSFGLQGIGFVSETEGWMGGSASVAAPYNFIRTTDGGATWAPVGYDNTQQINRIRFLTPEFGYMSGRKLHVYRVPLLITQQPQNQLLVPGQDYEFSVAATGIPPLSYQWRFNGGVIPGATNAALAVTNAQLAHVGEYDVVVFDAFAAVTSAVANLSLPYWDDFENYAEPLVVTESGPAGGYEIMFDAVSGPEDFTAIFGFDYSTVTYPTNIATAPSSLPGTTRGLYLTVNKDFTAAAAAAVNLYPVGLSNAGNFALKFDLWLNWANGSTSTEHALFGLNHSGTVMNRIGLAPSDGLFFALAADGGNSATSATARDYSVFRGRGGAASPLLMLTNNTEFGPTPPLGPRFDGSDAGLAALFPAKTIAGWATSAAGSAGLGWVRVEVRQVNQLITWLLNGVAIAQYPNTYAYTNGTILIGYNDAFNSIGDANSFAIIDNIRVEPIVVRAVELLSPEVVWAEFRFQFATEPYESYTVQGTTNLTGGNWTTLTNVLGHGGLQSVAWPVSSGGAEHYFRVTRP